MDSKRYGIARFGIRDMKASGILCSSQVFSQRLRGNLAAAWFDREKDASVKDLIEKNIVTMQQ